MTAIGRAPSHDEAHLSLRPSSPAENHCAAQDRRWVLTATILGSSLAFVDGTVVNLALPALQAELSASVGGVQWVVESYGLMLAALLLVGGALGDRYGRKRMFVLGVLAFTAASVLCGFAPDTTSLIVARGLQGVAAAVLVPGSLAVITASFPEEARGQAIGVWSAFSAVSAALGLVAGGVLLDTFGWRSIFFVNLPVGLLAAAIAAWKVPESRDPSATGRLDLLGSVLVTLGLGGATFGLIEASTLGVGDPVVVAGLVLGCLALVAFVAVEYRVEQPIVPPSLFTENRVFAGANVLCFLVYAALAGSMFFVPLNLMQVQGFTATEAGLASLPFVVLMAALSRWAGGLVHRYGARGPILIGVSVAAVGMALYAFAGIGRGYWLGFFGPILLVGGGMAITVAPLTTAVMDAVDETKSGLAAGVNNAVSRAGGLVAIALLGPVMVVAFRASLESGLADLPLDAGVREALVAESANLAAIDVPEELGAELAERTQRAIHEAFVFGFGVVSWVNAGLAAAGGVIGFVWMGPTSSAVGRSESSTQT